MRLVTTSDSVTLSTEKKYWKKEEVQHLERQVSLLSTSNRAYEDHVEHLESELALERALDGGESHHAISLEVGQDYIHREDYMTNVGTMERKIQRAEHELEQANQELQEMRTATGRRHVTQAADIDSKCAQYAKKMNEAFALVEPLKRQVQKLERDLQAMERAMDSEARRHERLEQTSYEFTTTILQLEQDLKNKEIQLKKAYNDLSRARAAASDSPPEVGAPPANSGDRKIESGEMVYLRNTVEELKKEKHASSASATRKETELKNAKEQVAFHKQRADENLGAKRGLDKAQDVVRQLEREIESHASKSAKAALLLGSEKIPTPEEQAARLNTLEKEKNSLIGSLKEEKSSSAKVKQQLDELKQAHLESTSKANADKKDFQKLQEKLDKSMAANTDLREEKRAIASAYCDKSGGSSEDFAALKTEIDEQKAKVSKARSEAEVEKMQVDLLTQQLEELKHSSAQEIGTLQAQAAAQKKASTTLQIENDALKDTMDEEAAARAASGVKHEDMREIRSKDDFLEGVFDQVDVHETGVAGRVDLRACIDKYIHVGGQSHLLSFSSQVAHLDDIVVERSEFETLVDTWVAQNLGEAWVAGQ